ncbi:MULTISPECIES: NADAR family protein [unclassified Dinoroseobacter]|uniref:NADAR family protein n=1 Tax=unclassified Dinoroseobacter TaxID=2620028 RepID=UPI003C79F86C
MPYHFFWKGPLSQWHPCRIQIWDRTFNCAEQAMMFGKAQLFGDTETAEQIVQANEPGKQKALGRTVRGFDDDIWDAEKEALVFAINLAKFEQNKGLRRKLFQTLPSDLAEASPLDTVWGIGLDSSQATTTHPDLWPGQNLLGRALTKVRDTLIRRHPAEAQACAGAPQGDTP